MFTHFWNLNFIWMILKAQMQTVEDKTVISGLRWYASDRYGQLITVSCVDGVGADFRQYILESIDCTSLLCFVVIHSTCL